MGYADKEYYGQCKLVVYTDAQEVIVRSKKGEWRASPRALKATLMIPGTDRYTIIAGNDTKTIEVGYGEYKKVSMGD